MKVTIRTLDNKNIKIENVELDEDGNCTIDLNEIANSSYFMIQALSNWRELVSIEGYRKHKITFDDVNSCT